MPRGHLMDEHSLERQEALRDSDGDWSTVSSGDDEPPWSFGDVVAIRGVDPPIYAAVWECEPTHALLWICAPLAASAAQTVVRLPLEELELVDREHDRSMVVAYSDESRGVLWQGCTQAVCLPAMEIVAAAIRRRVHRTFAVAQSIGIDPNARDVRGFRGRSAAEESPIGRTPSPYTVTQPPTDMEGLIAVKKWAAMTASSPGFAQCHTVCCCKLVPTTPFLSRRLVRSLARSPSYPRYAKDALPEHTIDVRGNDVNTMGEYLWGHVTHESRALLIALMTPMTYYQKRLRHQRRCGLGDIEKEATASLLAAGSGFMIVCDERAVQERCVTLARYAGGDDFAFQLALEFVPTSSVTISRAGFSHEYVHFVQGTKDEYLSLWGDHTDGEIVGHMGYIVSVFSSSVTLTSECDQMPYDVPSEELWAAETCVADGCTLGRTAYLITDEDELSSVELIQRCLPVRDFTQWYHEHGLVVPRRRLQEIRANVRLSAEERHAAVTEVWAELTSKALRLVPRMRYICKTTTDMLVTSKTDLESKWIPSCDLTPSEREQENPTDFFASDTVCAMPMYEADVLRRMGDEDELIDARCSLHDIYPLDTEMTEYEIGEGIRVRLEGEPFYIHDEEADEEPPLLGEVTFVDPRAETGVVHWVRQNSDLDEYRRTRGNSMGVVVGVAKTRVRVLWDDGVVEWVPRFVVSPPRIHGEDEDEDEEEDDDMDEEEPEVAVLPPHAPPPAPLPIATPTPPPPPPPPEPIAASPPTDESPEVVEIVPVLRFPMGPFPSPTPPFLRRVQKEWRTLREGLGGSGGAGGATVGGAIRVKLSETQPHALTFAIEGPLHTPYYQSMLIFAATLPGNYPAEPPSVGFAAYGRRMNPNLYENGRVCLSLLGTWAAVDPCEAWNPAGSTVLQVVVSIQSLVLVKEPYYNEAGYETMRGTLGGRRASKRYNEALALTRIDHWIDMVRRPPVDWVREVREHFRRVAPMVGWRLQEAMGEGGGTVEGGEDEGDGRITADGLVLPMAEGFKVALRRRVAALEELWRDVCEGRELAPPEGNVESTNDGPP